MTIASLLETLSNAGVSLALTDHGSIRVTGARLPEDIRPVVTAAKPILIKVLALDQRLSRGWMMCDRAESDPDRERLESHWRALLREYEHACDRAIDPYDTREELQ